MKNISDSQNGLFTNKKGMLFVQIAFQIWRRWRDSPVALPCAGTHAGLQTVTPDCLYFCFAKTALTESLLHISTKYPTLKVEYFAG